MPIHDWPRVDGDVFHSFHVAWLGRLTTLLNDQILPRPYYALAEPVVGEVEPDLLTLRARTASGEGAESKPEASSSPQVHDDSREGAVALAPSPVVVQDLRLDPYTRRTRRITIRDERKGDAVVAVIELVSRGNKSSRARAEQFIEKDLSFLDRGIHLLVIDLHKPTGPVPNGFHTKVCELYGEELPRLPEGRPLSAVSYQVLAIGEIRAHVAPLKVCDNLPDMPVFLEPHRFIRPPLESSYGECYRSVPWKFREALEANRS
ncbi:MAG: DUF4058 family protein [Planctomycetes bacterium]|nr:DUF4058 family protein [Planctomycetota bacterium]